MTTQRKRLVSAAAVAILMVCGTPAAVLAETDVVLENESQGTNVETGESTFTNNNNVSSSATFDPPAGADAANAAAAAPQSVGNVQTFSAPSTTESGPVETETVSKTQETVSQSELLFVGLPLSGGSLSP